MRCLLFSAVLLTAGTVPNLPSGHWLELIDTSQLPVLRDNESLQASNHDRPGGNDDVFGGTYSFLRAQQDGGYVLLKKNSPEAPGEMARQAGGQAPVRVGVEGIAIPLEIVEEDIYTPYLRMKGPVAEGDVLLSVNESMSFALRPEPDVGGAIVLVGEPARLTAGTHVVEVHPRQGELLLEALRFAPSPKTPNVVEAEHLETRPIAGARVERADVFPVGMSGHSGIAIQHHRENDGAEFVWELAEAGSYRITPRLYNDPARMPVRLTLDGVPLAPAIVCAAAELDWPAHSESRDTPRVDAGRHLLGILCAQAPVEGTDPTTFLDYFEIRPKGLYEGEHLQILDADGAPAGEQRLGGHSNGGQLWFRPEAPDAELKLAIDVARGGHYTICGYFAMAPDYGRYRLWVNGKPAGAVFDGYAPGVKRSDEICFGTVELKGGVNHFVFRGAGKARESSSYMLGLDVLILREE